MTQQAIEALLRKKIGLETVSVGSHTITRGVQHRMKACGVAQIETYFTLLQTSPQELEALIEETIVPETWFFRDREPFVFLSRYVMSEWLANNRGKILRILSVPCATGEEPYSIAIALMELGLTAKNFIIDAVDISNFSLNIAKKAVYKKNSFRGNNLAFQKRYFTQMGDEYHLHASVKDSVNFFAGNLLDPYFLIDKAEYDIIFCRNVLIYFDQSAIEKTIKVVERLLNKQGLLFVGHAETGLITSSKFVAVRHSFAFAHQKVEKVKISQPLEQKNQQTTKQISQWTGQITQLPITHTKMPDLAAARKLADGGQLDEANLLCKAYLNQNPTSAEAYFLLGQVHQASGKVEQAEQYFHRAIYLEPNHYESLMHLALLKENRRDIAGATIIRERIERLQKLVNS